MRAVKALALTMLVAACVALAATAGAWERLASTIGIGAAVDADQITEIARSIAAVPAKDGRISLAASAGEGGHWRLVNRAGEPFTAAGQVELAKGFQVLASETEGRVDRLRLHLTADTLFKHPAAIAELPAGLALSVHVGRRTFPLERNQSRSGLDVMMAPGILVEAGDRATFDEIAWQLTRPVSRSSIRTLALEPGGPAVIRRAADVDPATRRAKPDPIDPGAVSTGLGSLAGQIVLLAGRREGDRLRYRPATGPEGLVATRPLADAAASVDVNLIVLETSSPRQPGSRNYLWQRIDVANADKAHAATSLGELLHSLAGEPSRLVVSATRREGERVELRVASSRAASPAPTGALGSAVAETWSGIVSETAGSLSVGGVTASLVASARQRELDRRIVPWLPSSIQLAYGVLVALGLLGLPTLRRWWHRLWPGEQPSDYANQAAYWLAQSVRMLMFVGIFLPIAGLPGAFARLVMQIATWRCALDQGGGKTAALS